MSSLEKSIKFVEDWHRKRGLPVPKLRSDNPDPVKQETEERKLWSDFIEQTHKTVLENLGLDKPAPKSKKGSKKWE